MNDERMAISEIGAAYADYTFGKESRKGIPFTYLLRDVLQYDKVRFHQIVNALCNDEIIFFENLKSLSMIQNTEWKMLTEHAISFLELVMAKMKFSTLSDTLTQVNYISSPNVSIPRSQASEETCYIGPSISL